MFSNNQITLGNVFIGLAAIAAFLTLGDTWISYIVVTFAFAYLISEVLIRNLPTSIRYLMESNTIRLDGSVSEKRTSKEQRCFHKIKNNLRTATLFVCIPSACLIWFTNREVLPFTITFDAVASYKFDESWNDSLDDEERAFDQWHSETKLGLFGDADTHKRMIAGYWPLFVIGALVGVVGCFLLLKSAYFSILRYARDEISDRGERYRLLDLARRAEHSQT